MLQPACRDGACLLWSHVNYEHPYPERERKLELGEYSGRSKSQVMIVPQKPLCAYVHKNVQLLADRMHAHACR